jgi:hypothetical protein
MFGGVVAVGGVAGAEPGGGVVIGGGGGVVAGGGGGGVDTRFDEYGTEPRETGIWLPLAYMHCM